MGESPGEVATFSTQPDELPEHIVTISPFRLDLFEVTVARFRKFVSAYPGNVPSVNDGADPSIAGSGWNAAWTASLASSQAGLIAGLKCDAAQQTWTDSPGSNESYPMGCVDWYEAFAFCAWDGGWLPSEAEWEYAAAGGSENRTFPWGAADPSTGQYALFFLNQNTSYVTVGSYPLGVGKYGQYDLAGSVWEWTSDVYDAAWYSGGGATCTDCENLGNSGTRVNRGGHWADVATVLRGARRSNNLPTERYSAIGFRCARAQ
jgi:formylglycine-generating enzyme required for sulfatase activity